MGITTIKRFKDLSKRIRTIKDERQELKVGRGFNLVDRSENPLDMKLQELEANKRMVRQRKNLAPITSLLYTKGSVNRM